MIEIVPDKVKVGGINYEVVEKDYVEINGSRNYQGSCYYSMAQIEVMRELSEERKEEVFVHELLHAILNEAGFDEQDEDLVNRASKVLYQVLKDNEFDFRKDG